MTEVNGLFGLIFSIEAVHDLIELYGVDMSYFIEVRPNRYKLIDPEQEV